MEKFESWSKKITLPIINPIGFHNINFHRKTQLANNKLFKDNKVSSFILKLILKNDIHVILFQSILISIIIMVLIIVF